VVTAAIRMTKSQIWSEVERTTEKILRLFGEEETSRDDQSSFTVQIRRCDPDDGDRSSDKRAIMSVAFSRASVRPIFLSCNRSLWVKVRPSGLSATSPFIPQYQTSDDAGRTAASGQYETNGTAK
jgi:hypothetical protein